jgi:molybdopterin-containing oxidoreductase family iron-sulfur binding subunit
MRLGLLVDLQRCIGCDTCTLACKQENGTPKDFFFARVLNMETGEFPQVKRSYLPVLCNHCADAPCVRACPNKSIFRRPDGIVIIDQERCNGTGACVSACPYGNIYLNPEEQWYFPDDSPHEHYAKSRLENGKSKKCTYCAHRLDQGLEPACVVSCPAGARIFGDLDDPNSKVSQHLFMQKEQTRREPFRLLEELGTDPSTRYLRPLSQMHSGGRGNDE